MRISERFVMWRTHICTAATDMRGGKKVSLGAPSRAAMSAPDDDERTKQKGQSGLDVRVRLMTFVAAEDTPVAAEEAARADIDRFSGRRSRAREVVGIVRIVRWKWRWAGDVSGGRAKEGRAERTTTG